MTLHGDRPISRRHLVGGLTFGAAMFLTKGAFAEELARTAPQTEGPFYPDSLPLDTDNDLLVINDEITPAVGEVTHLTGKILGPDGEPIRNALVEIWQCDNNGAYLHSGTSNKDKADPNFQGFGRFLTGSDGSYYFRTIKPVPYPGRTPHIHYKIWKDHQPLLVTQCYIRDHPSNARDGILRGLDPQALETVMVDFTPIEGSRIGALAANFDVVLGTTPAE